MVTHQQRVAAWSGLAPQFFGFFEWAYGTPIGPAARQPVEVEIVRGLAAPDPTVVQLIDYVVRQHNKVRQITDPAIQHRLRAEAPHLFCQQFLNPSANGRGLVLSVLHSVLEQVSPGCTGVAVTLSSLLAPMPNPAVAAPAAVPGGYPAAPGYPMPPGYPPAQVPGYPPPGPAHADPLPGVPEALAHKQAINGRAQAIDMEAYRDKVTNDTIKNIWRN